MPRLRERQRGDAARGAEPDDDDVGRLEVNRHAWLPFAA